LIKHAINKKIFPAEAARFVACKAGTATTQIAFSAPATNLQVRARPAVVLTATATAPMLQRARVLPARTLSAVRSIPPQAFALRYAPAAACKG